ncbi:inorganic phosphate transporter [Nitriliruptoraceae bacterium ZYF776]|nr:inorganic phosphate transporter [Profundirhabdus halotolerans]
MLLLAAAVGFAVVNGLNDGGALLAVGLSVRSMRPLTALVVLTAAVVVAPLVLGTAVATTLTSRLVTFDGRAGEVALLVAVVVAVGVTSVLARRGLPTSLTLAVVGALTGAGLGAGLTVAPGVVLLVLVLALVAPVVGLAVAWLLTGLASRVRYRTDLDALARRWHVGAFVAQSVAYGANDGQKMLAVLAVAAGANVRDGVPLVGWQLAVAAAGFLAGAVVGLPRIARTLGGGVVPVRPPDAAITELAASSVVLGTAAVGSPVSMTQAIAGAQVGTGVTRGLGRIRWREVGRIGGAWIVTLPAAGVVAAVVAAVAVATLT